MKKIINGKKYDTDTAKKVAEWSGKRPRNDFSYCESELYVKKTGEYFLHGEGGPLTIYASHPTRNTLGWGEKIIPISEAEAREWAEDCLTVEEYEAIFGKCEE